MTQTLLIELGCEELPAGQLTSQARLLLDGLAKHLVEAQLCAEDAPRRWLATPRRLAIMIEQVQARQTDRILKRKGPAVQAAFDDQGKPTRAAHGFAQSVGLEVDQLQRLENEQGEWLYAEVTQPGQSLEALLPDWLQSTVHGMVGARSMRWSDRSDKFLRPVRWLLVMHGAQSLSIELFGLLAGNLTWGHRIHSPGPHAIEHADHYVNTLKQACVLVDFDQRQQRIVEQIQQIEHDQQLRVDAVAPQESSETPFSDPSNRALLGEVCGLVEWPVATLGTFDPAFLAVPAEALISAMREHQKCFALHNPDGSLAPKFITIANLESQRADIMAHGYERVIRPRLADAQFFYQQDLKQPLSDFADRLKAAVFHPKLGSMLDKSQRIAALSHQLADAFDADRDSAERAGALAKHDLMSQMVAEFPELQGTMGRYYALAQGESGAVATAIESHYLPRSAADQLPEDAAGQVVALADRLDTLIGIFAIGQKPKSSKDPFALRRAALAVVRILHATRCKTALTVLLEQAGSNLAKTVSINDALLDEVQRFIQDRMSTWIQAEFKVDINTIRAVEAGSPASVHDFVQRCRQLQSFAEQDESMDSLVAANKRAANILRQAGVDTLEDVDRNLLELDAESALLSEISNTRPKLDQSLETGNFDDALRLLAQLRPALDSFFDQVMVMDEREPVRLNRLALLSELRRLFIRVADIALMGRA